jgi:hypothetical protein
MHACSSQLGHILLHIVWEAARWPSTTIERGGWQDKQTMEYTSHHAARRGRGKENDRLTDLSARPLNQLPIQQLRIAVPVAPQEVACSPPNRAHAPFMHDVLHSRLPMSLQTHTHSRLAHLVAIHHAVKLPQQQADRVPEARAALGSAFLHTLALVLPLPILLLLQTKLLLFLLLLLKPPPVVALASLPAPGALAAHPAVLLLDPAGGSTGLVAVISTR